MAFRRYFHSLFLSFRCLFSVLPLRRVQEITLPVKKFKINSQGHTYSIEDETKSAFLVRIFSELPNLKTVDLSEWVIHDFLPLQKLHFLTTLVLYDVRDLETSIDTIATLTTLKFLFCEILFLI